MEKRMTVRGVVALAAVLSFGSPVQAQGPQEEWEYAPGIRYEQADLGPLEKGYFYALGLPLEGIVESTLREVARVKIANLAWEPEALKAKVEEMVREAPTPALRYKASLVKALFDTPGLFLADSGRDYRTPSELYRAVARRLETNLLAGN